MRQQEDFDTLAALDALGSLEPDETRLFEELSRAATPAMLLEADALREAAALIGTLLPAIQPPASTRASVLRLVQESMNDRPRKKTILASSQDWTPHLLPGIEYRELSVDQARGSATVLFRIAAGSTYPPHSHLGGEDCYVLEGRVLIGDVELNAGDFHHAPAGSDHGTLTTEQGCTLLLVLDQHDFAVA